MPFLVASREEDNSPSPVVQTAPLVGFPPACRPLDAVRTSFAGLATGPHPGSVDGRNFAGLPDTVLRLDELADLLRQRSCSGVTRDLVWVWLVERSRRDGSIWTMACAGVALPMLVRVAAQLTARFAGDPADIDAAVLAGFLDGLTRVDVARPGILVSLRWRAFRAGMAALREALDAPAPLGDHQPSPSTGSSAVTGLVRSSPSGHPDLVLARAVTAGVITAAEAALIGATRLDHVALVDAAAQLGRSYPAVRQARNRAERRLAAYLADHTLPGEVPADDSGPGTAPRPTVDPVVGADGVINAPARVHRQRRSGGVTPGTRRGAPGRRTLR